MDIFFPLSVFCGMANTIGIFKVQQSDVSPYKAELFHSSAWLIWCVSVTLVIGADPHSAFIRCHATAKPRPHLLVNLLCRVNKKKEEKKKPQQNVQHNKVKEEKKEIYCCF